MKTLYNVFEGILDIDDTSIDVKSDEVAKTRKNNIRHICRNLDAKYNESKNTLYSDGLALCVGYDSRKHIMNITTRDDFGRGMSRIDNPQTKKVSLDSIRSFGLTCDMNLRVTTSAIEAGFKLSDIQWTGKNHTITIIGMLCRNGIEDNILNFLDHPIDPSTELYIEDCVNFGKLLGDPVFSKFSAVGIYLRSLRDCGLDDIKSNIKELHINSLIGSKWCPPPSSRSYASLIAHWEYDYSGWIIFDDDEETINIKNKIKNFLKNNPKTKLFVNADTQYNLWTHIYLKNDEVKAELTPGGKSLMKKPLAW